MEQNFDLLRWLSGNSRHVFLPQWLFCQYDPGNYDRGIDKTLGLISAVSRSVGGGGAHFPDQRPTVSSRVSQVVAIIKSVYHRKCIIPK